MPAGEILQLRAKFEGLILDTHLTWTIPVSQSAMRHRKVWSVVYERRESSQLIVKWLRPWIIKAINQTFETFTKKLHQLVFFLALNTFGKLFYCLESHSRSLHYILIITSIIYNLVQNIFGKIKILLEFGVVWVGP